MQDFKHAVREWLADNQRSQAWLASQVGVTTPHVHRWLKEDWPMSEDVQGRIARVTGQRSG